jgi:hypothetical protein
MNTVLITEINCVMLYPSFTICVMYTLQQYLTRQRGLIKFYAKDKNKLGSRPTCAPELQVEHAYGKDFARNLKYSTHFSFPLPRMGPLPTVEFRKP